MRRAAQAGAAVLIATLFVLLVVRIATGPRGGALSGAVADGDFPFAPDFELSRIDGRGRLRLSSLRGRVVVLNFWASWCNPCKSEAQSLEAAARRWLRRGVTFVGVDSQDFTGDARAFVRHHGLTYASVHDGSGKVMGRYGVTGFPETWVVDRQGRLVDHVGGPVDTQRIDRAIRRAWKR